MGNSIANNNPENTQCSVVGLFGILIQISLGVLSFSVLVIKRYFENPQRPWKIWGFDTVKQVISQLLAHFINLVISLALTSGNPDSDTCLWYFITNIFDNTVGVCICVFSLRIIEKQLYKRRKYQLISGNYYEIEESRREALEESNNEGQQPQQFAGPTIIINYKAWLFQLAIWITISCIAKVSLFGLEYLLENQLDFTSKLLLGWIQAYPHLQLVVVIVIVPVIMNGLAFWVQDNFLKKRPIPKSEQNAVEIEMQNQSTKNHVPFQNEMEIPMGLPLGNIENQTNNREILIEKQQIVPSFPQ